MPMLKVSMLILQKLVDIQCGVIQQANVVSAWKSSNTKSCVTI